MKYSERYQRQFDFIDTEAFFSALKGNLDLGVLGPCDQIVERRGEHPCGPLRGSASPNVPSEPQALFRRLCRGEESFSRMHRRNGAVFRDV